MYDVAIIGAGISGLFFAKMCDKENISYILFEESDAIGGRCVDLAGPSWIHKRFNKKWFRYIKSIGIVHDYVDKEEDKDSDLFYMSEFGRSKKNINPHLIKAYVNEPDFRLTQTISRWIYLNFNEIAVKKNKKINHINWENDHFKLRTGVRTYSAKFIYSTVSIDNINNNMNLPLLNIDYVYVKVYVLTVNNISWKPNYKYKHHDCINGYIFESYTNINTIIIHEFNKPKLIKNTNFNKLLNEIYNTNDIIVENIYIKEWIEAWANINPNTNWDDVLNPNIHTNFYQGGDGWGTRYIGSLYGALDSAWNSFEMMRSI